jgi:uncharacterized repeat protein (TIGR02543 family)
LGFVYFFLLGSCSSSFNSDSSSIQTANSNQITSETAYTIYLKGGVNNIISDISTGINHTLALNSDGLLFAWGNNGNGQLGLSRSDFYFSDQPRVVRINQMENDEKIISIAAGGNHSLIATNKGSVYSWGNNEFGQLGLASNSQSIVEIPTKITFPSSIGTDIPIKVFATGYYYKIGGSNTDYFNNIQYSLALTNNGKVFSWGSNENYQLGDSTSIDKKNPTLITFPGLLENEKVINISPGEKHVLALTSFGRVYAWGEGSYGELGAGSITRAKTPFRINFPMLNAEEKIVSISAGKQHSLVATSEGKLLAWGDNGENQLGLPPQLVGYNKRTLPEIVTPINLESNEKINYVSAGTLHSTAMTNRNRVLTWGNNDSGQLGNDMRFKNQSRATINPYISLNNGETLIKIDAKHNRCFLLTSQSRLLLWGSNNGYVFGLGDLFLNNTVSSLPIENNLSYVHFNYENKKFYKNDLIQLPEPFLNGYSFDGWFLNSTYTQMFVTERMPDYSFTLYAKFSAISNQ